MELAQRPGEPDLKFWEYVAFAALLFELAAIAIFASSARSLVAFGVLFLVALAATGAGSVLGFLFGVPRFRADASLEGAFLHNSNLEQISDWLTKIIVGATLVQVSEIADAIGRVSLCVGGEIGKPGATTAACSVLVFSFFAGFMWAYLWISVRLRGEFDRSASVAPLNDVPGSRDHLGTVVEEPTSDNPVV